MRVCVGGSSWFQAIYGLKARVADCAVTHRVFTVLLTGCFRSSPCSIDRARIGSNTYFCYFSTILASMFTDILF